MASQPSQDRVFLIRGMDCPECARSIEKGLFRLEGVDACNLAFTTEKLRVSGSVTETEIVGRVKELGFEAIAETSSEGPAEDRAPRGFLRYLLERRDGRLTLAGGLLILPGLIWTELLGRELFWIDILSLGALVVAGLPVAQSALRTVWKAREININVLMSVAALGAVVIGVYTEAGMVMVLFSLGEAMEGYTASRARSSIRSLMTVTPQIATQLSSVDGGPIQQIRRPVAQLGIGDRILVRPGERIPMDGLVVEGVSEVNQAPITGEGALIDKKPDDHVFAGTINGTGSLELRVSKAFDDTLLSRMIRLVEKAQEQRAPSQRFVDRFARIYTPAVVLIALLVALLPPLLLDLPFWNPSDHANGWLYRGLALLVIACPCALVLSTPVTIISAISNGARSGVLFKGGAALEELSRIRGVAFDKTGTLTQGDPSVVHVRAADCAREGDDDCEECDELVALASAVQRRSEHPLAKAMVTKSVERGVQTRYPEAARVTAMMGKGVVGSVEGRLVQVGSHKYFDESIPHLDDHCAQAGEAACQGQTPVFISSEGTYLGYVSLSDKVRESSRDALRMLRALGLKTLVMLTGDSVQTASRVAEDVGLTEYRAELLPAEKVRFVEDMERRFGSVAMVGDGINDAPALAKATVGIAVGGAAGGTDQALETADIALMSDDLRLLPFALRLSRAAMRTIQFNVGISIGIKLVFLVVLVMGLGTMWMAVLADAGTALLVTLNGMRLLRRPSLDSAALHPRS